VLHEITLLAEERRFGSRLRILAQTDRAGGERLVEAASRTAGLDVPLIEACLPVAEADWVRASQSQFPPTKISERLWIVPTWHEVPDPDAVVVRLDPGVAFGTGTHPTTQLCLAWLDQNLKPGSRVLDYGCGSGILAIAAGKLGAGALTGVDVDEQALAAARINSAANDVRARYTDPAGLPPGAFDIVLANILSNPLKLLAPALLARVASGGALVLSGVLERQAEEVMAAYRASDSGLVLSVWGVAEGWACLAGRRAAQ
jgi:ribosomal protein L11 methyltransferase